MMTKQSKDWILGYVYAGLEKYIIEGHMKKLDNIDIDERQFDRTKAIVQSMTKAEREKPEIINPSRKRRIAAGCGQQVEDVNKLLAQFRQMQQMFKQMNSKGKKH